MIPWVRLEFVVEVLRVIGLSPCQPDHAFESSITIKVITMQILWPSSSLWKVRDPVTKELRNHFDGKLTHWQGAQKFYRSLGLHFCTSSQTFLETQLVTCNITAIKWIWFCFWQCMQRRRTSHSGGILNFELNAGLKLEINNYKGKAYKSVMCKICTVYNNYEVNAIYWRLTE